VVRPQVLQSWAHALDDQFIRPGSRISNLMEKHKMTFVAFSPLAQGRLLDKYDPSKPPSFEPGDHRVGNEGFGAKALAGLKPKLATLKTRFGSTTEDLAAMSLNYVLAHPHVACVIPGFRNERQARCNLVAADRPPLVLPDLQFIRSTLDA
jgi:aryl-alcohol dehydrogenase-like predicted oxidoreductase